MAIVAEVLLGVTHSLIASERVELEEIDTVVSHPQVLGQCTLFLRGVIPQARAVASDSSAEAVRSIVSEHRRAAVAIGTRLAAEIYGGIILREGIEDRHDNETRFAWLARTDESTDAPLRSRPSTPWRTSLVFWGTGANHSGWLVRCLDEFARRGINLTKIESRPLRERLGSYMFFVDLDGHPEDASVADAIAGVSSHCETLHVMGSYRAAPDAAPDAAGATGAAAV